MKIYITRHGETDWNAKKIIQGRTDIELNETGIIQAHKIKEDLQDIPFDRIVCSPMKRAKQTAMIINEAHKLEIVSDERVIERGFGDLEGTSLTKVDFTKFWSIKDEDLFPNSEKTSAFYERIQDFIDEVIHAKTYENILVVAHGGVSLPFYTYFKELPEGIVDMRQFMLGNCEVACYSVDEGYRCKR